MKRLLLRCWFIYFMGCILIIEGGCEKGHKVADYAASTTTDNMVGDASEPTSGDNGIDLGSDTSSDMTTSSPMGSDMSKPPVGDEFPRIVPVPDTSSWSKESDDGYSYPKFPWPPPEASASAIVPRKFFLNRKRGTTLGYVDKRLEGALERNGYFESSYYSVPGGFALVTKMEQISASGESRRDNRWVIERQPLQDFSLGAYLRALLLAASGRYRVIVFIVTPYPFSQSGIEVTSREASRWLPGGMDQLPESVRRLDFAGDKCTALIYEFTRTSDVADPALRMPSPLPGRTHLMMAGIWKGLAR